MLAAAMASVLVLASSKVTVADFASKETVTFATPGIAAIVVFVMMALLTAQARGEEHAGRGAQPKDDPAAAERHGLSSSIVKR